jgi:imidazolonepropionase-like amidohydrolase
LTVSSPEEARKWTTLLLGPELCQDLIKVALESGPQLSEAELQAIVEVAHERDTIVSAHVTYARDLTKAVAAGVDDMAHMIKDPLPDEVIDQMIAQNVYVVPTLKIFSMLRIPSLNEENLKRFVAAGGKVAVGTDYNNPNFPEDMYLLEMEAMHEAGMTPMQVIVAATMHGAHVCNLETTIGTLQPGKMADVLVVEGNPLENLKALADVQIVIHGGIVIRNEFP